jgi:hypothetical protein
MKTYKYIIKDESNKVFKIINDEIKKSVFKKRYNLSGVLNGKEYILHLAFKLNYSDINYGPYVRLKLTFDELNKKETKLTLKRMNGLSYIVSFWSIVFCIVLFSVIYIYQLITNDPDKMRFLSITFVCIVSLFILEMIAKVTFYILVKRIEKIIKLLKINYAMINPAR